MRRSFGQTRSSTKIASPPSPIPTTDAAPRGAHRYSREKLRPWRVVSAVRGQWCQGVVELGPGADAELAEYLVQVVVDGAFADVQAGGGVRGGQAPPRPGGGAGLLRGGVILGGGSGGVGR